VTLKMAQFDTSYTTYYSSDIVNVSVPFWSYCHCILT